jgi:hypothetical protein
MTPENTPKQLPLNRRLRKFVLLALGAWLLLIIWGIIFSWRRLPEYAVTSPVELPVRILDNNDYGELINTRARPYIVKIENENRKGAMYPMSLNCRGSYRKWT